MITIFKKQKKEEKKKEELKKETKEKRKEKKEKEKGELKTAKVLPMKEIKFESWRVIERPIISEKVTFLEEENKYVFKITKNTNKVEVKKAIEALYGVKVKKVNIINTKRKKRRLGRVQGYRVGYKKAIVTLEKGYKIEVVPR